MDDSVFSSGRDPSFPIEFGSGENLADELAPLVSICCPAYNQESIIHKAINGILLQKIDFTIEIIIHDDASTDQTSSVIRGYQLKYPAIIKPVFQSENLHSKGIKFLTSIMFPKSRGKYIAICDGDDYWTDPNKLQKQVDFLNSNSQYGMVYSKARIYNTITSKYQINTLGSLTTDFNTLLVKNGIPTSTVLFRRILIEKYQEIVNPKADWKLGDRPIWLFIASQCKIKFMNEITTTYLKNSESVSRSDDPQKNLDFIKSSTDISLFFIDKFQQGLHLRSRIKTNFYKRSFLFMIRLEDKGLLKEIYSHLLKTRRFHIIPLVFLLSILHPKRSSSRYLNLAAQKLWF